MHAGSVVLIGFNTGLERAKGIRNGLPVFLSKH
jgi:hypothetical protein